MDPPFIDSAEMFAMTGLAGMFPMMPGMGQRQREWSGSFPTYSPGFATKQRRGLEEGDKGVFPDIVLRETGAMGLSASTGGDRSSSVLIFRVRNPKTSDQSFCSVLEFSESGAAAAAAAVGGDNSSLAVYLPWWLMQNLHAEEGQVLNYSQTTLPKGKSAKLQPTAHEFYDVTNPRAVLESILGRFTVLSKGMEFTVKAPGDTGVLLGFKVVEVNPGDAICIVDTDLNIEFAPMPGMDQQDQQTPAQKPTVSPQESQSTTEKPQTQSETQPQTGGSFVPFGGEGHKQTELGESAEGTELCSNCGRRIASTSFEMHKMRCERINIRCALCNKVIQRIDEASHMNSEHTLIECPKCKTQIEKSKLSEHEKLACPMGLVPCPFCSVDIKRNELDQHSVYCGSRTENCSECGKLLKKQDLLKHIQSGCKWLPTEQQQQLLQFPRGQRTINQSIMICPSCMQPFTDLEQLENHASICTGQQKSSQPPHIQTPQSLLTDEEIARNLIEEDAEDNELLLCEKCLITEVRGREALRKHQIVCEGPAPIPISYAPPRTLSSEISVCPICSKEFADAASVQAHVNLEH